MSETVRVNFGKPIPLFPLPDTVLLPHAILPLHVFEPRYQQMIGHCLDRSGQLAIATFDLQKGHEEADEAPPLRAAVCVGQIIQHDALADGRYNVLLHGVCRAQIRQVFEPRGRRAYRIARLAPIEPVDQPPQQMPEVREDLRTLLTGPRLQRLRGIETLLEWIERDDVPTHALLELIGFALVRNTELKYRLLAEPDAEVRAVIIKGELQYLDELVHRADHQNYKSWPKGMSWN
jgi:Lon protease-like protein